MQKLCVTVRTSMQGHVYSPIYRHVHEFCFPSLAISYFDQVISRCCLCDHLFLSSKTGLVSIFWAFWRIVRNYRVVRSVCLCRNNTSKIIIWKGRLKLTGFGVLVCFGFFCAWFDEQKMDALKKLTRQWWEYEKWNLFALCVYVYVWWF